MSGRCCCCSSAADSAYATRACVCVGACCARYRNWSWGLKTEELHAYDDEMCCVVATAQLPYIDRHRQNNGEYGRRSAHAPYRRWTGSGCVCVCGGHTGISWRLSWQISFCIYINIYKFAWPMHGKHRRRRDGEEMSVLHGLLHLVSRVAVATSW